MDAVFGTADDDAGNGDGQPGTGTAP
jgi:hypothetical protein